MFRSCSILVSVVPVISDSCSGGSGGSGGFVPVVSGFSTCQNSHTILPKNMAAALSRVYADLCRRYRLTSKKCPFWFYSLFCASSLNKNVCLQATINVELHLYCILLLIFSYTHRHWGILKKLKQLKVLQCNISSCTFYCNLHVFL